MPVLPITDPVLIVALVMAVVLLAPLLFTRLRVPGLVGLLVAGVAIGPHGLGLLAREGTIDVLGTIGLLYIMFLAGLEVNLHEFARHRKPSVLFGLLAFALPQGLGALTAHVVLGFAWPSSILLGSLFASHTLIAYPIARRLGLATSAPVTMVVGATILTDILALLVLAGAAGAAGGGVGVLFWLKLGGLFAVYVALVAWGLPRLGRWFFRTVRAGEVADFGFVLAAVFACAFLATLAGVEPIIGAFLAGLALNRLVPASGALMNRIAFVGEALFIPFFLISVGMLVDLGVLASAPEAWVVTGVMLATTLVTKVFAVGAMKPLARLTRDEAGLAFGLSISQAAAALATALVGYRVGLFDDAVLNGTVLIMLVTCVLGPFLTEHYGRRVARKAAAEGPEAGARPQRIVVPLANADTSEALMELALLLRLPDAEAPVYPLTVVRGGPDADAQVAVAERLTERAVLHAAAADVPVQPTTRIDLSPARGIAMAARELRASTVVLGWTGHTSPGALVFGTVLDQVLEATRAMVIVSRLVHPLGTARRVLVAVPPLAWRERGFGEAARALKALASQKGAEIVAVAVTEDAAAVERALGRTRPAAPVRLRPVARWADALPALQAEAQPADILVLVSARRGALAWRPALDRLPRLLASGFPEHDLLTLYLSEAEVGALVAEALESDGAALDLPAAHVTLGLAGDACADVDAVAAMLRRILAPAFPGAPGTAGRLAAALVDEQGGYAPELRPGVVFFHGHTTAVRTPLLLVGVSADGLTLPRTSGPTHAVLVLLAPSKLARGVYLRRLALVAQLVRGEGTVEALRAATTPGEARDVLLGGLRATPEAAPQAPPPPEPAPAEPETPEPVAG